MLRGELLTLLEKIKHIHFVGIGGISMSALAEIMKNRGYHVTGSDIGNSDITEKLCAMGIEIFIGHSPCNISEETELIIHTAAVKKDNCELLEAAKRGIAVCERPVLLGAIMEGYDYPIAVAGTHGKTTTTSMISKVLMHAGRDPSCLVGGQTSTIGGNVRIGSSQYIVCEACEYMDSFLTLTHKIAVVLNMDADHLDYFRDIGHIKESFLKFINIAGPQGVCVACADDKNALEVAKMAVPRLITYGIDNGDCDFRATNLEKKENGAYSFDVVNEGKVLTRIELGVPGRHNVLNALAACAVAGALEVEAVYIASGLAAFRNVKRRFEFKGSVNGAHIVDDYAHHPTEIAATLAAARGMGYRRIICVFQPHTYTRTEALFDSFITALSAADEVVLAEIYAAREQNTRNISSKSMAERIAGGRYFPDLASLEQYLRGRATAGDLIITMGAGDIYKVGEGLLRN